MFQVWRWTGSLAIGGMAMVASWTHLHDLMASRGQLAIVAILGPLAIDGMAIMATGLILSSRGHASPVAKPRRDHSLASILAAKDQETLANWPGSPTLGQTPENQALANEWDKVKDMANDVATMAPGQPATTLMSEADLGQLADDLDAWERGIDLAIGQAGQEMATAAEALANGQWPTDMATGQHAPIGVAKEMATVATPPVVANVSDEARELILECLAKGDAGPDVDKLVATTHGVSTRTARRWRGAVAPRP